MSPSELLKPTLYAAEGTAAVPDHPALHGGKCTCGHVFFPMQTYGCEVCGRNGDALQPLRLSGRGKLIATAMRCVIRPTFWPSGATPAPTAGTGPIPPSTPRCAGDSSMCGSRRRPANWQHGKKATTGGSRS